MPVIAIYFYSVLIATNGSKRVNVLVCITEHFGALV